MNRRVPTPAAEQDDEELAAYLAAVDEGIASMDAGRGIPYEKIRLWLLSWGTENELPPPE
jgi:predicted transcriptional regulator